MNVHLFQQIAAELLQTHYERELDETPFCEETTVLSCMGAGTRPYQALSAEATKQGWDRISPGGSMTPGLAFVDELKAMAIVNPLETLDEQPTTCPKCGTRTDLDELYHVSPGLQVHRCLNVQCGYEFVAEPEDPEELANSEN